MLLNKKRLKPSYPADVATATHLLAFNPDKVLYYGSQAKKAMYLSSGDIDLIESINPAKANDVADKLASIVKNIKQLPNAYLGDVKSGVDPHYIVNLGDISKGKIVGFNKRAVAEFVKSRDFSDKKAISQILSRKMTLKSWFELQELLRKKQVLRWTADEIAHGYKSIRDTKIYLRDTIPDPDSMTKVDMNQFLPSLKSKV